MLRKVYFHEIAHFVKFIDRTILKEIIKAKITTNHLYGYCISGQTVRIETFDQLVNILRAESLGTLKPNNAKTESVMHHIKTPMDTMKKLIYRSRGPIAIGHVVCVSYKFAP